ncbi:MAG: DISARM system SNF2-like helicase DrmD [Longimicrobiales bacterium]|nr:DISARM system SNF2-like helicase DrmD [Longimicrobiales bacterium]
MTSSAPAGSSQQFPDLAPKVGDLVRVRSRHYLVEDVAPPPNPGDSHLLRLACLTDDAQGEALEVLWEREVDARLLSGASWERVASRGFDQPRLFSAYLHALRWNGVTSTDPNLFQAPYRAGIEVKAYQLEPLRMALAMPRVNVFIADDVGLGKTIEAGLILREMLIRQKVRRCVVSCPPSVARQWQEEMEERFGLSFVIYDRDFVARQRTLRGYAVNPWTTHSRFIISHALLRDESYAAPLRDWLGGFAPGAMLILDEAHNAAPASGSRYAVDSKLTRTVRDLAGRFEHKLFLSATPHNGHSNSFSALLEILDPQKFCRGVPVEPKLRNQVLVRRLKADLREIGEDFPNRKVIRVDIGGLPADAPELVLSTLLQRYREARQDRLQGVRASRRASEMLVIVSLQKRLLSSIEAFARTLAVHRRSVLKRAGTEADVDVTSSQIDLLAAAPDGDDPRAELPEDDVEAEADLQMGRATAASGGGPESAEERALLDQMLDVAGTARYEPDPRVRHLIGWIKDNLCPDLGREGAAWLSRRVLIFTEYTDTKRYLQQLLDMAVAGSDRAAERIVTFHGGMSDERREAIKAAFNVHPDKHPLRILIATEAAREGVNLQNHCSDLFHFDVPWNPSRMEQRNGRLDRKLQRAKEVRCHYYVLTQRPEDRVLDVLVEKSKVIHDELGSLSPVVERRVEELLAAGIRHQDQDSLVRSIEGLDAEGAGGNDGLGPLSVRATARAVQQEPEVHARRTALVTEVESLQNLLRTSKEWIGLDDRHFRHALSAALEMMGVTGLEPVDPVEAAADPANARWRIPRLDERKGADVTWAGTLDALRAPRGPDEKLWEWRRESPIRPVVFRDPGTLDADVVHLHLEHRVVKRLLGRFTAQGFTEDLLSRACVVLSDDPVPRVVLVGRLSLYGDGASRLHDTLVAAAAEWTDPAGRGRTRLRALGEGAKSEVLELLEEALARPTGPVPETVRDRLKTCAARDVEELRAPLEGRASTLADRAVRDLAKRGENEAEAMRAILEAQEMRIRQRQKEVDSHQLSLSLEREDERRQLAADQRHWSARLVLLQREKEDEPARIRKAYEVRARQIEPVGLVYLWPVSG